MKNRPTVMRILVLAALVAGATADTCEGACVTKIFSEMVGARTKGFTKEDGAVYGYLLHKGWKLGGETGLGYVKQAVEWIAKPEACNNDGTKAKIVSCLKEAGADNISGMDDKITANADWNDTAKGYIREVFGNIANQLAPDSEAAKKWTKKLSDDDLKKAVKVYNIVGAYKEKVEPVLAVAFDNDTDKDACTDAVKAAVGYEAGKDLAEAIANKGEKAWEILAGDKCFGEGSPSKASIVVAGETKTKADALTKINENKTTADTAVTAQLEALGVAADGTTTASPAVALSAAVAVIALML